MRAINKGAEPVELKQYRAQPSAAYDGANFTTVKDCIRKSLLTEQGYLCAYCMQRIDTDSMKVEHWHARSPHPEEQLAYRNMLGCCSGNEGAPRAKQHCDTRKEDSTVSFNPANSTHHDRMAIRYAGDGTVRSGNAQFDSEINDVLNLNWARLKSNRKETWKAVTEALSKSPGSRTRKEIQRMITIWKQTDAHGRFHEYCDVAIYYLEKKLARVR